MTASRQAAFWLAGVAGLILFLYVFRGILLPFVLGMAIAYFLDPVADGLERRRLPRTAATSVVLAVFFLAGLLLLVLLAPLVQAQFVTFLEQVPAIVAWVREKVLPLVMAVSERLPAEDVRDLRSAAGDYAGEVIGWLGRLAKGIATEGLALVNLLSLLVVTPIVAFYLLRDWDRIVAVVDGWLPRAHAAVIREQVREIDRIVAGWVRGVGTVVLLLAVFYAVALTVIGLEYGLVIGIAAGLISFIPYVGAIVGFVVGVGLALFQFSDWVPVALVAGTFVVGQALEGNFLTPWLVGERIGLHPVWVIFALFAGGVLFGFVGLLLAVPAAAVVGVLGRFAMARYLESPLYRGAAGGAPKGGAGGDEGPEEGP